MVIGREGWVDFFLAFLHSIYWADVLTLRVPVEKMKLKKTIVGTKC